MQRQADLLNGPLWNKIPLFALPLAATGILEQLFNASDLAVVGNFAGAERTAAVAAVGANSPIINLLVNLFIGISLGANVVIANAVGRGDRETVRRTVHTAVLMSLIGGVLTAVLGELLSGWLLGLLKVPADVLPLALRYLRIYLLGMPVILLYNFEAAIFRSVGDTRTPLLALALSGVLNVALNLFFVAVLKLTVSGVAIATVLSNAVSAAILWGRLTRTGRDIRLEPKALALDRAVLGSILRIGLPAGIQSAVFSAANIVIQSAINSLGKTVMAASSAAYNIETFAYYLLTSFGQACTTFVGQNYGAGQIKRCKRTLLLCLGENYALTGTVMGVILLLGRPLLSVFDREPEVVELGYVRLAMVFGAYLFTILYDGMSGYLRGFGISAAPAALTMTGVCGVRLAWIFFVFPAHRTFRSIMLVFPISLAVTAVLIFAALMIYRPSRRHGERES